QRVIGGEPGAGFGAGEDGRNRHKTIPPSRGGGFSADRNRSRERGHHDTTVVVVAYPPCRPIPAEARIGILSASHRPARVRDPSCAKCRRSAGLSISNAIPGKCNTVGRMPRASAAARCGKKLSSPKRNGTASGGDTRTALEPCSSCDGAIVKAGAGRCASISRLI